MIIGEKSSNNIQLGKKLSIYLIDGNPQGPRICEIGNWVGKAIYCPIVSVHKIIHRPEFDNPVIYCLKGPPSDNSNVERIFIGSEYNMKENAKQLLTNSLTYFKEVIFFVSKFDDLNSNQIKYLESRLIQLAVEAETVHIENGIAPSVPKLHEADISDMEYFIEQMKLILPVMGFKFLS
jgi:hypothetical protein